MPLRFQVFFEALAWLGPVRVKNGQYMNLQRLDSSIQGSLGEAERLMTAIKFEVAYIPDIQASNHGHVGANHVHLT